MVLGMGFVYIYLYLMIKLIHIVSRLFEKVTQKEYEETILKAESERRNKAAQKNTDESEIIAVISAAVAAHKASKA